MLRWKWHPLIAMRPRFSGLSEPGWHRSMPIGPFDTQIAAHAQTLGVTLVTNNLREFKRVPGLRLENWADAG